MRAACVVLCDVLVARCVCAAQAERSNWTDMRFMMRTTNGPLQMGRSIYEKHEAVGCAKALDDPNVQSMCFGSETLLSNLETDGGSAPDSSGNTNAGPTNNEFCKSRRAAYTIADPMQFRAYKLCDDTSCSGGCAVEHVLRVHTCRRSANP